MKEYDKAYAGILLITPKDEIIMQMRDDKPGVINPGMVSIFGGTIERNESPEVAAKREIFEELNLKVNNWEKLGIFYKNKEVHGEDCICHIFIVREVDVTKLTLNEGKGIILIESDVNLSEIKLTLLSKEVLDYYLNKFRIK